MSVLDLTGSAVLLIIGRNRFQNGGTISHIPGNRSDLIQGRTISDQSVTGYRSVSRLDSSHAAEGAWLTDGTAGIRA